MPAHGRYMTIVWTALLASGTAFGCRNGTSSPPSEKGAGSAPSAAGSARGAGDKSGKSIADARPLGKTASGPVTVPCDGTVYYGPFVFSKSPETLTIHATAKSPSGTQVCVGGEWVDAHGKFLETGGVGCVEQAFVVETDIAFEYSPHNGGHGERAVYYALKLADTRPAGCKSATVSFTLR